MKNNFLKLSFLLNIVGIIESCCVILYVQLKLAAYHEALDAALAPFEGAGGLPDSVQLPKVANYVGSYDLWLIVGLCLFLLAGIIGVVSLIKERKKLSWISISISIIAILILLFFIAHP